MSAPDESLTQSQNDSGDGRDQGTRRNSAARTPGRRTAETPSDTSPSVRGGVSEKNETPGQRQAVPHGDINRADLTVVTASEAAGDTGVAHQGTQLSLHVSSLSTKSTKEHITAYFEAQGESVNVTGVEVLENGTATVHLEDITDEEKEQLFKKRHKINRRQVEVEEISPAQIETAVSETVLEAESTLSPSSNTLLVSNLPQNADEHLVEMYFEASKSGGCFGAVESIDFVEPRMVCITLKNSEVASNILEKKVHKLQGTELQIKRWEPSNVEESSASSLLDSMLEVSNLPQDCSVDMLEQYFQNPKCGGCSGGVKAVRIIGSEVAQVEFTNASIAAKVAKREHKLNEARLQIKYLDTCQEECPSTSVDDVLEICNLPHNVHEDTLELYLESSKSGGSGGAVKEIKFVTPGIARVHVSSSTVAANIVAKEGHKLQGNELQITLHTPCLENAETEAVADTLEVSNLAHNTTEDILEMYFESRKSGGYDGAVKNAQLIGPREARVQFSTPETADLVVKRMHKLNGAELQVKVFHKKSLPTTHPSYKDTLEVSGLPDGITKEVLELYFENAKSGGCSDAVKAISFPNPGVARVQFTSDTIAANVIAKKDHKLHGVCLQIEYVDHSQEEAETDSQPLQDTLEVSNLPIDLTKELLELYFENPKCGGCDGAVKALTFVRQGVAHVQFSTAQTAANVFGKKMHKLQKAKLQVKYLPATLPTAYELDKLILENLPEVEDDFLHLFIEICLKLSDDEFSVSRSKDKALIIFAKEYSLNELQAMIKDLQGRKLKQGFVTAVLYEECRSIQIHNITKHYEEDYLRMYFETPKRSGGGQVEDIQMLGEGQVMISFKDPKVVSAILERPHPSLGPHLKIERNDPLRSPSESSENISSVDVMFDPLIVKYLSKHPELLLELEVVKNLQIKLKFDDVNGKVVCSSTKCTRAGWKDVATKSIRSYVDSNYITSSKESVPKDALQELYGHLTSLKGLHFELNNSGTLLRVGGEKKVVHTLELTLKDIFDRYTVATVSHKFDQNPANFHFLVQVKLPELKSQLPQVQITEDPLVPSLKIQGTKKEISKFQDMLPKLCNHSKISVEVQPHIARYIGTNDGQMQLKCILKRENIQAAAYITSKKQPMLLCDSASLNSVKRFVTSLPKVMSFSQRRVPPSFEAEQENYLQLCQQFEKQHHVQVNHSSNTLVVAGLKSGVDIATPKLYQFIEESCTIEDCIMVERGELRLLLSHMKDKWEVIKKGCKSSDFPIKLLVPTLQQDDDDPLSKIVLRGERDSVKTISGEISQLKKSICKRSEVINQVDASFLTSESARTYLDGIEFGESVTIEVVQPESSPKIPLTVAGNCHLKCTAKLTEKTSIYIFIGDICDFDMADVIVNAANCELKHIGGVALAISRKGGPIIDKESTQFVRKNGNLNTGDAWLTTNVGNLPCKALVHAVGPVWGGNHQKDTRLLESACIQALQKSSQGQVYQSIAFPAISAGVYAFPIEKCAQCMVNAMIKFANSDTPSPLRSIHFVLHYSNSADVKYFISALQRSLPADSVSITNGQVHNPEKLTGASLTSSGMSQLQKTKAVIKKSSSVSKGTPMIRKVPPGVLDCIKVIRGSLLNVQADVYVNTTNNQLNLSSGAVSIALLKAGGKGLQDECTKKGPIKIGDVAVTGPGQIPCKHIFHTVMPPYSGKSSEKVLRNSLSKCFKECSSRGVTSIAIPSIGTGNLHYPKEVVAKITVEEAITFLSSKKRGSLEFIHLVIFMEDAYRAFQAVLSEYGYQGRTMLSMEKAEDDDDDVAGAMLPPASMSLAKVRRRSRLVGSRSTTLPSTTPDRSNRQMFVIDDLKVHLVNGDITDSDCEVITNPTNSNMKLVGAGVAGAILSKGGQEQQDLCDAVISNIDTLNEDRVVYTKATGKLKCKHIFHINYQGRDMKKLSEVILMCLKKAEKMKMTSIAFPAVGAGTNSCLPRESAAGMLQAIRTFVSNSPSQLHQIHIVVYEPSVLQDFKNAFQHPEEAQPSIIRQVFNYVSSVVTGGASNSSTDPKVVAVAEEPRVCEPLEVKIYGKTENAVNNAHHKLGCWLDEKLSDRIIENKYIQSMSETDEERLRKLCTNWHVELIDFDRNSARIRLKGSPGSVDKVYSTLIEDLHQYEKKLGELEHAKQLYELVRWKRMDSNDSEGENYDLMDNFKIEMTQRAGETSCTVGAEDDVGFFTVDFASRKEIDHHTGVVSDVERIDLLKQLQELSQGEKPQTWDKMPPNCQSLLVVKLDTKSKEYGEVLQRFDQTMRSRYNSVIQIERIQNPKLYLQYVGRRKEMDRQNPPGHQNERLLFHGTSADSCPKINQNGFNRSFAGKNAIAYGKGVYFARDASYSATNAYSPPDIRGYKYIYFVRALTGEFTLGNSSMIVPPHKDAAKFIEYDSVVDNVANPGIFVIFQDALVYPDYLITFQ